MQRTSHSTRSDRRRFVVTCNPAAGCCMCLTAGGGGEGWSSQEHSLFFSFLPLSGKLRGDESEVERIAIKEGKNYLSYPTFGSLCEQMEALLPSTVFSHSSKPRRGGSGGGDGSGGDVSLPPARWQRGQPAPWRSLSFRAAASDTVGPPPTLLTKEEGEERAAAAVAAERARVRQPPA